MTKDVAANGHNVQVRLIGGFRMIAPNGSDLSPRGSKSRGLLAILLTTPEMKRSRQWLRSTLWSGRGTEQAKTSLRQALSEIRKAFGIHRELIQANRNDVWLDTDRFRVDLLADTAIDLAGREVLEGVQVGDPEFDVWLNLLRSRYSTDFTRPEPVVNNALFIRPRILLKTDSTGTRLESMLSETMNLQVGRNLTEVGDLAVATTNDGAAAARFALSTSVVTHERAGYFTLRLVDTTHDSMFWTRQLRIPLANTDLINNNDILHLAYEAAEQAAEALIAAPAGSSETCRVDVLVRSALKELFTFDAEKMRVADGLLKAAQEIRPHAVIYAWRCFVRYSMVNERTERNVEALLIEADDFAAKAIEMDPKNSLVLSLISQFYILIHNDVEGANQLAKDAEALNAGNPMAHVSLALVALRMQDPTKARELANRALLIAAQSPHRHWWHMFCCLAEMSCDDFDAAISSAKAALCYAPKFRPPMRHLYALYLKQGDVQRAIDMGNRLRRIEPDFSLQMIREDTSYPAGTLRKTGLVDLRDVT